MTCTTANEGETGQWSGAAEVYRRTIRGALSTPKTFWSHSPRKGRPSNAFTFAVWFQPQSITGTMSIAGKREGAAWEREWRPVRYRDRVFALFLPLLHIPYPTREAEISFAALCLKNKH